MVCKAGNRTRFRRKVWTGNWEMDRWKSSSQYKIPYSSKDTTHSGAVRLITWQKVWSRLVIGLVKDLINLEIREQIRRTILRAEETGRSKLHSPRELRKHVSRIQHSGPVLSVSIRKIKNTKLHVGFSFQSALPDDTEASSIPKPKQKQIATFR